MNTIFLVHLASLALRPERQRQPALRPERPRAEHACAKCARPLTLPLRTERFVRLRDAEAFAGTALGAGLLASIHVEVGS